MCDVPWPGLCDLPSHTSHMWFVSSMSRDVFGRDLVSLRSLLPLQPRRSEAERQALFGYMNQAQQQHSSPAKAPAGLSPEHEPGVGMPRREAAWHLAWSAVAVLTGARLAVLLLTFLVGQAAFHLIRRV